MVEEMAEGWHPEGVDAGSGEPSSVVSPEAPLVEPQPYHQPMPPIAGRTPGNAPAMDYANLSPGACRARLRERKIPVKPAGPAKGVATPVRLDGPLHGVRFRGPGPKSKFGIMDCRLVLALEAFAEVLARHDVVEVHFGNTYRPRAYLPGRRGRKFSQHAHALAIDIVSFVLKDKTVLRLPEDYHGERGKPSCGPAAVLTTPEPKSIHLRNLVCDVARAGIFHHMLTPNFDAAHQSHFHFDIKRDGKWITIR